MKIAIISDIHDNLVNLKKCLNWCKNEKIKYLICCGDITNSETLNYLTNNFKGQIYLVKGNIEIYNEDEIKKYKNIIYYGKTGRIELDDKIIGICHEPYLIKGVLEKGKCDIIFYGHTHRPHEEEKNSARIINPGTLAGMFTKSTFAVWNTKSDKVELKITELL